MLSCCVLRLANKLLNLCHRIQNRPRFPGITWIEIQKNHDGKDADAKKKNSAKEKKI